MRVYITGTGALSSLGNTPDEMFANLKEGRTGVRYYPEWAKFNGLHSHLGAPVPDYDIMKLPRTARRTMSRMSEMGTLATQQAIAQARWTEAELHNERTLIILGSTTGSPITLETYFRLLFERGGPQGQVSTSFFKVMNHSVAANVASALGFKGALMSPSSACSTSAQAMIIGWELIRAGLYDRVIAGGADELHHISAAIFDIVFAASRGYNDKPDLTPKPFDSERDGLVVSEGAGVVIMESEKSAQSRDIRPLAEFRGGAYYCDGSHMSQSSSEAMHKAMSIAIERCGIDVSEIGYVNAHATGTLQGDGEEAETIREIFGEGAAVSSLKGHFGHSLAACGTLEVIASMQMMKNEVLIPTRNLRKPAEQCAGLDLLMGGNRLAKVNHVLSNNFAFGGMNTSLVISSLEGRSNG
jgi:3-oxoacyl-[acyl-carrier-protein] synthase II